MSYKVNWFAVWNKFVTRPVKNKAESRNKERQIIWDAKKPILDNSSNKFLIQKIDI